MSLQRKGYVTVSAEEYVVFIMYKVVILIGGNEVSPILKE